MEKGTWRRTCSTCKPEDGPVTVLVLETCGRGSKQREEHREGKNSPRSISPTSPVHLGARSSQKNRMLDYSRPPLGVALELGGHMEGLILSDSEKQIQLSPHMELISCKFQSGWSIRNYGAQQRVPLHEAGEGFQVDRRTDPAKGPVKSWLAKSPKTADPIRSRPSDSPMITTSISRRVFS